MKLTEVKQRLIRVRLSQGATIEDIAQEIGVSKSTVLRYKKKTPVKTLDEVDTGDNNIQFDNSALRTKSEEKFLAKMQKDSYLYEDREEGWVYHLDKENYILKTSGLWWGFIVYPESAPKGWMEKLEQTGLEIAISPLHDKDKWTHDSEEVLDPKTGEIIPKGARYKAGDPKKAHWHGIVKCNKSTSFKEMNKLIREITQGPYVQKIRSIKNAYDYFTHETDAAKRELKYQYDRDEIIRLNKFLVEPNRSEIGVLQCEIAKDIKEHNLETMLEVAEFYEDNPVIMTLIWSKPGFVSSLVRALYMRNHPEAKVKLTKEISDEEYVALFRKQEE